MAWWTLLWAVTSFLAILTSPESTTTGLPSVLDALLAAVVMTGLFAVIPTAVRLQLRRWIWQRRERRRADTVGARTPAEQSNGTTATQAGSPPAQSKHSSQNRPVVPPTGPGHREGQPPPDLSTEAPEPEESPGEKGPPERLIDRSRIIHEPPGRVSPPTVAPPAPRTGSHEFVTDSPELRRARELHYPLARHVRSIRAAPDASSRYVAALETAEVLAMVLGMSAAAWLNHVGILPHALSRLGEAYERGVAFGVWLDLSKQVARQAANRHDAPSALAAFSDAETKTRLGQLDVLVQERNRYAHGHRPRSDAEAERRLTEVLPALATALDGAAQLEQMPWVVTESSSFQVHDRTFDVTGRRAMSDHPAFERGRWNVASPLADDRVYIMSDRTGPIDLTPFVVIRTCDTCLTEELFHSARLPKAGGTELKSFTSSHGVTDRSLDGEIRALKASTSA